MISRCITFILVIPVFIFLSCSKREPVGLLKDYEVFFTQNESHLFTYLQLPDSDTLFVKYKPTFENGVKYVTEYSYTKERIQSERKFRVTENTKELVKDLNYDYYDSTSNGYTVIHGKIIEHVNIENNKLHKDGKYFIEFTSPNKFVTSAKVKETYLADTVMQWKGKVLPALKFSTATKIRGFFKYIPIIGKTFEYNGTLYYIKGVGLVKITSHSHETAFGRELLDVQTIKEETLPNESP